MCIISVLECKLTQINFPLGKFTRIEFAQVEAEWSHFEQISFTRFKFFGRKTNLRFMRMTTIKYRDIFHRSTRTILTTDDISEDSLNETTYQMMF